MVRLAKTESGEMLGTFESPDQSAQKLKLSSVTLDKSRLAFELKLAGGKYEGKLNAEGTEATGSWSQGGAKLPLTFKKTEKVAEVRRPQTPKPPYPYKSEAVTYPNKPGGVTLAGTLTTPSGLRPVSGHDPDQRLGRAGSGRDDFPAQAVPRSGRHLDPPRSGRAAGR